MRSKLIFTIFALVSLAVAIGLIPVSAQQTQPATGNTGTASTTAGEQQAKGRKTTGAPASAPLAPPKWGQTGDSAQSSNTNAAAAERAQQEKGSTLGVNNVPKHAKPNQPQGQASSEGKAKTASGKSNTSNATQKAPEKTSEPDTKPN
jgi:negative regulator of sigma E activity